jgi:hypothetical protein
MGEKHKGRTMMFLLRTAFWMGLVLALLPTFGAKQATAPVPAPGFGATEAVTAASATFGDMIQFCSRQPEACAAGAQFASAFGQRAQAGAKMLYEIVGQKLGKADAAADAADASGSVPTGEAKPSQHTLTSADLVPAWHGPNRKDRGSI